MNHVELTIPAAPCSIRSLYIPCVVPQMHHVSGSADASREWFITDTKEAIITLHTSTWITILYLFTYFTVILSTSMANPRICV